tara:strand:- start:1055 stop:1540 length:486 start_codon:yes stop_codon:yes gene_type:complete
MNNIFINTLKFINSQNLNIINKDLDRPWGGFFDIDENDIRNFIDLYYDDENLIDLVESRKISLKILIIIPNRKLSWQYHHRRNEIWKVVKGKIKVVTSHDNVERKEEIFKEGDEIRLSRGERHRIIGLDDYALVAEIWIHTDKANPSDEDDIVRVQDDYGR